MKVKRNIELEQILIENGLDVKLQDSDRVAAIKSLHLIKGMRQPDPCFDADLIKAFENVEGDI